MLAFETILVGILFADLVIYALLGGADFGGGMWDLLAFGPRARRQRLAIEAAIGQSGKPTISPGGAWRSTPISSCLM